MKSGFLTALEVITQNKADQIHAITITYHSYSFFRFLSISQT